MVEVKKVKRGIAAFISSEKGQRFFNFAYSIGAAIVIWGALFKILHLPGGNALLSIGMGTEVLMFVLTAFDRPPREYHWEEVFPALDKSKKESDENVPETMPGIDTFGGNSGTITGGGSGIITGGAVIGGGVIGGAGSIGGTSPDSGDVPAGGVSSGVVVIGGGAIPATEAPADLASSTSSYMEELSAMTEELKHLKESTAALNNVSDTLLEAYRAVTQHSEEISDSSTGYVEQMKSLNRNITGLNTIYEIQLKAVSSQLDAIDRVNRGIMDIRDMYEKSAEMSTRYCEETEKMARYMKQLNSVYEKMITAMTINMYRPMMGAEPQPVVPATEDQPKTDYAE